ncbi:MAG: protein kinase [Verrucomicrobiota bacterium]
MDTKKNCPGCRKPLENNAPDGLCPECLLQAGLGTGVDRGPDSQTGAPAASPAPSPPLAELAPHFPQLDILECLGRGGMGVVYKARQKSLDRFVALKLLAPERVGDPQFAERFTREAKALAALNHPNIVTIYDFGQAGGFYYLLMEFVDGVNLRQAMKAGRFTPEQALAVVPPVCEALQYAHNHGIVHRDIKPENLLLDKEGRVMIADFGIAKMLNAESGTGVPPVNTANTGGTPVPHSLAAGTPQYMAPEQQTTPQQVDNRADIYSLGVVLYEMLTGELPGKPLEPPSRKVQIDVRLDEVVLRALEKNPELRYQQASVFKTQVETIALSASADTFTASNQPYENQGLDYRSKATLWGLPWLHVTSGIDPKTGRARVAKGIIAIGGKAKGVFAFGGMATGVFASGGVAVGLFAFGGCAVGLVAFGGLALALALAIGGAAIAPLALGGGALGYLAFGGKCFGVHVLDSMTQDPVAKRFFESWGQDLMWNLPWLNVFLLAIVLPISVGIPLWLQHKSMKAKLKALANASPLPTLEFWQAMEAGNYARAWEKTAAYFQRDISKEEWVSRMEKIRRPLGKTVSRKQLTLGFINPGRRFEQTVCTVFENGRSAKETVFAALQPEGEWKIEKYDLYPIDPPSPAAQNEPPEKITRLDDAPTRDDNKQTGAWWRLLLSVVVQIMAALPLVAFMTFIVPKFEVMARDFSARLPDATVLAVTAANFAIRYGWLLSAVAILMSWAMYRRGGRKWLWRWTASVAAILFAWFVVIVAVVIIPMMVYGPQVIHGKPARVSVPPIANVKLAPRLQFRLVADAGDTEPADTLADPSSKELLRVRKGILLDESAVSNASLTISPDNKASVTVDFNEAGAKRFAEITGANIGKRLAVVLDGKVLAAPTIRSVIRDQAVITGNFTAAEVVETIARALNSKEQTQPPPAPATHR